jgi:hypothetical protein
MRDLILHTLLNNLENCDFENGIIRFKTRDINTEKNNELINESYDTLRKLYKLSPNTRKPKKFTSQTVLQICKSLNYNIERKTKYYRNKELKCDSTCGFYTVSVN